MRIVIWVLLVIAVIFFSVALAALGAGLVIGLWIPVPLVVTGGVLSMAASLLGVFIACVVD